MNIQERGGRPFLCREDGEVGALRAPALRKVGVLGPRGRGAGRCPSGESATPKAARALWSAATGDAVAHGNKGASFSPAALARCGALPSTVHLLVDKETGGAPGSTWLS